MVGLSLSLVFWVVFTELLDVTDKLSNRQNRWAALWRLPRHYKGMVIAHLGVAIAVTGVAITSTYDVERDVRMTLNETITVGPYDFQLVKLRNIDSNS